MLWHQQDRNRTRGYRCRPIVQTHQISSADVFIGIVLKKKKKKKTFKLVTQLKNLGLFFTSESLVRTSPVAQW